MASQVFYRKWRPQSLAEIIGQEHVTQTLLNALANERVSHAYLFCGPRGTGKTTTARGLAKAINCLTNGKGEPCNTCEMCQAINEGRALDIIEVDAASNRGINEIRDLREKVNYAPNMARRKVYIIDEVHMLTNEASNALLKTLEEPPPHVIFILATTEVHKLLPTILSRCQRFDFHRHSQANMVSVLSHVCEGESIKVDAEALKLIARAATGSLRDALNLLQQLNTLYGNEIKLEHAQALLGISGDRRAGELIKHIVYNDVTAGMATINSVNSDGLDLRQFNRDIVEYLRRLLLVRTGSGDSLEITAEDLKELKELASKASTAQVLKAIKRFGQLDLNLDNYSTLPLELALVDCILPVADTKEAPAARVEPEPTAVKPAPEVNSNPPAPKIETKPVEKQNNEPPVQEITNSTNLEQVPTMNPNADTPQAISSTIEQLQLNWTRIIRESPNGLGKTAAAALLRSARPLSIENDVLVVSVRHQYHKEKMDILENQKTVDKIASSFLGRPCKVRCVYEHENNHLVKAALEMGARMIDTEE